MIFVMNRAQGLTFIELFIVIIILGILAGVSFLNFRKNFNQIELNSFSSELQSFMNYLTERAIVERKTIYLNIDNDNKKYWAQFEGDDNNILKIHPFPSEITIENGHQPIAFYPDGSIDKVTIKLINRDNRYVNLTTKEVFSSVRLQPQE